MRLATLLLLIVGTTTAAAETIAVIGTGHVGGALGPEFAEQGHKIVYGSRDPASDAVAELVARTSHGASARSPADAVVGADIVILAVPGMLVEEITKSLGDLSGMIIIDPTNPLTFAHSRVGHGVDTSNSELIQQAAPDAHVVKAFNTVNWNFMVDPDAAGGPVSVPLAGNNDAAKAVVADLVTSIGLEPIDVGSLANARWLEGMAILLVNSNFGPLPNFNFYLRKRDQ